MPGNSIYTRECVHRSTRHRLTKKQIKTMLELNAEGVSKQQIALKLGCTDMAIHYQLKIQGIPSNYPTVQAQKRKDLRKQLMSLHGEGHTIKEIAKLLAFKRQRVVKLLKQLAIKPHTMRERYTTPDGFQICRVCNREESPECVFDYKQFVCNRCKYIKTAETLRSHMHLRFQHKKSFAKKMGIGFTLTSDQYWKAWELQEGKSAYTGQVMVINMLLGIDAPRGANASIDRIDNDGIYEFDNVVFCTNRENTIKHGRPVAELDETWQANLAATLAKRKEKE